MRHKITIVIVAAVVAVIGGAFILAMLWNSTTDAPAFDAGNASYTFLGDSFTLKNGQVQLMGHSGLPGTTGPIPMGYTLATSSTGDLEGNGSLGAVAALYRGFGADLIYLTLFGFEDKSGAYTQVASSTVYMQDASVQSVSVENGITTVNLLIVGPGQQNLPHYEQKPDTPLTLRFRVAGGEFAPQQ